MNNILESLKNEINDYINLNVEFKDKKKENDKIVYIIDKTWLKAWKSYINYNFIKQTRYFSYYYENFMKKTYELSDIPHPNQISNQNLIYKIEDFFNDGDVNNQENLIIRHNIDQRKEVKIVNQKIWEFFHSRYGGGPKIIKKVHEESKIIDMYDRKINLIILPLRNDIKQETIDKLEIKPIYISRNKQLYELKDKLASVISSRYEHKIDRSSLRFWKVLTISDSDLDLVKKFLYGNTNEIINTSKSFYNQDLEFLERNPNVKLEQLNLADTDVCCVEVQNQGNDFILQVKSKEVRDNKKCDWCHKNNTLSFFCVCKEVWYCSEYCKENHEISHEDNCKKNSEILEGTECKETKNSKKGLVGLQNLGNTCFMNTTLQCIANCYELTNYFLNDSFKKDLNVTNPLGSQGTIARAYANLVKNIYYGTSSVFSPWSFKRSIGNFQPMFSGYHQHDCQEFLNYLLDGLHEDLNKVLKKPLIEKDETQKDDIVMSNEMYIDFLRRNQSLIVDLFYGQFKSTLYCPNENCNNISTTFDPFLSLSLPLNYKTETFELSCLFIFYDISLIPLNLTVTFNSEVTAMAMRNKIAKILKIHPFSFIILKLDMLNQIYQFVNTSFLLKINKSENNKPYFLFEIDPRLFYSLKNSFYIKDQQNYKELINYHNLTEDIATRKAEIDLLFSEDYIEDLNGTTNEEIGFYSLVKNKKYINTINGIKEKERIRTFLKINLDQNNGFSSDYIKIVINFKYVYNDFDSVRTRSRMIFPRIMFFDKNISTRNTHLKIFSYLSDLFRKKNHNYENLSDEELFDTIFRELSTNFEQDNLKLQKQMKWPYRIRIKSVKVNASDTKCAFCKSENCSDCLLPFSEEIKISDLLGLIKNEEYDIDNNFHFLSDRQKILFSNENKDFTLELTWLEDVKDICNDLTKKRDFNFRIQKSTGRNYINIYDCFKNFVKLEKLQENNEWFCSQCKKHQKASKKIEILKVPNILIIHLKRFKNNSKIDSMVDFPLEGLNLKDFVKTSDNNLIYDLFAISNHYGGIGFGHYIAYAKNSFNGNWYQFDDSRVFSINNRDICTSSAYVLFYKKRGLESLINIKELYNKTFINFENNNIKLKII